MDNTFTISESFTLDSEELAWAQKKYAKSRLVFAIMLKFFQARGRFPNHADVISPLIVADIANQLQIPLLLLEAFNWEGRSCKLFRQEIRHLLGFREATVNDGKSLVAWLIINACPQSLSLDQYRLKAHEFLRRQKIEIFSPKQIERYIRSASHQFEKQFFSTVTQQLSEFTKKALDELVDDPEENTELQNTDFSGAIKLRHLKKDIAGLKLNLIVPEIKKLRQLTEIALPENFLQSNNRKLLKKYYARVLSESPSHIEECHADTKYATLAIFCHLRRQFMLDTLADLVLQLAHRIKSKAETQIKRYILSEVKRVDGKFDILFLLANTAIEKPSGIIQEEIYPHVDQMKLKAIVNDLKHRGKWYQNQVQTKMLSLYSHNNRRIFLALLEALSFQTDQADYAPLLGAVRFILENKAASDRYYSNTDVVPVTDVISNDWRPLVLEPQEAATINEKPTHKIHRMHYEVAVLEMLCTQLRCKNIWIKGAYRYRDPNEDLPQDFDNNTQYYFDLLALPLNPDEFIEALKKKLDQHLCLLNDNVLHNNKVNILENKKGSRIKLSPSEAQAEPHNIAALQREIIRRWPSVPLIDILKEVDLRIGFTKQFHSVASRESLDKALLQKRLLLCLYAIGSNTGLKSISAGHEAETYSDLRYIKRRYLQGQQIRNAITDIVNAIIEVRDPSLWSEATTGCACDSKHISAWDQNLMTSWHARYRKQGVMIYWHVDKKAACIHSQLKTCTSSEVGAMMMGFLRHDTKMDMKEIYVDTHGQSTIGFGFSGLLHFDLLPRLKNLYKQKLAIPSAGHKENYPHLKPILTSPVNWELIRENYLELVKYTAALKIGRVEADVMIKRFSSDNYNHPVYKALLELGKAIKTIFLCRYLSSEVLRIEIHEALNVVERLNSIMGFIFYGKRGEISTNNRDDQELAILCLHLIQVCMVYMNTLMIQEILSAPHWKNKLTLEDKRAITPLIHAHLNPYGLFLLNMDTRLVMAANEPFNNQNKVNPYAKLSSYARATKSETNREIIA